MDIKDYFTTFRASVQVKLHPGGFFADFCEFLGGFL
jgi:hypothetical protein